MYRLAVVASHPVQYQAPLFRALARVCDLTVLYCHRQTAEAQGQAGFDRAFEWDIPLLDGYRCDWLDNVARDPGVDRFAGCDTPDIERRLAAGAFDACLVNGWYLKSYLQAIRSCRTLGIPVLMRGDSHLRTQRSMLVRFAKYVPYRVLLRQVDAHLCVGSSNREYLRHYGVPETKLFFAPHFVDNARFETGSACARQSGEAVRLRQTWGVAPDRRLFLFAGKLVTQKRVADFIRALADARRSGAPVHGAIVGSGPEESSLRTLAAGCHVPVTFVGFVNQAQLPAVYAAADCLVLPSASESWGLVVNEAMAAGLPTVVSDCCGCAPDLVSEGETGFTFASGDVSALAARLVDVCALLDSNSAGLRAAVSRRIASHSPEQTVAAILAATKAVTAGTREPEGAERTHA